MRTIPAVTSNLTSTLVGWHQGTMTPVQAGTYEALLQSENHFKLPDGSWSGGGPFFVVKHKLTHEGKTTGNYQRVGGPVSQYTQMSCSQAPAVFSVPAMPSWSSEMHALQSMYPKGYSKARPGNPMASTAQFLIELRDLPRVPGALLGVTKVPFKKVPAVLLGRLGDYRELGSEYLNVVFGWKPFVSDLRKMYNLQKRVDRQLAQIIRENGKYIRRRATISNSSVTTQTLPTVYPSAFVNVRGAPPSWANGKTHYVKTSSESEKYWFSGSFRYYIPDIGTSQWTRRATLALFGATPSPETLYQVLPWSWLVDWFSNVGDVVSNVSPNAVDNLTLRYSFIMRHTTKTTEWKAQVYQQGFTNQYNTWPRVDQSFVSTSKVETKSRIGGGNPFGLNVSLPSLSGGQLAILAALGISRSSVR